MTTTIPEWRKFQTCVTAKETRPTERFRVVRLREKAEPAVRAAEAVEGRSFYIVTTVLGGVMFLLAVFACFIMSQTLLLR